MNYFPQLTTIGIINFPIRILIGDVFIKVYKIGLHDIQSSLKYKPSVIVKKIFSVSYVQIFYNLVVRNI